MESHTRLDSYGRAWHITSEQLNFELLWERVQSDGFDAIIGAIYHPPKPVYPATDLLRYIASCLETIARDEPTALVVLAGDFNGLINNDVVSRTALKHV